MCSVRKAAVDFGESSLSLAIFSLTILVTRVF